MKLKIKTIFLDLDGFLIDSSEFISQAYTYTLDAFGIHDPEIRKLGCISGGTLKGVYGLVAKSKTDFEAMAHMHDRFQHTHMELLRPNPGAKEMLTECRRMKINTCLFTNRTRNHRKMLAYCGLESLIDHVIGGEHVTYAKPHPEGIEKGLIHFKTERNEAVMAGDTEADILAGKGASVATVGLETPHNLENLVASGPDYIISNLFELIPMLSDS